MASSDNSFNTIQATCDTSEPQLSNRYDLNIIARACKRSPVGKNLPDAFYVHVWALHALEDLLQQYESCARSATTQAQNATIVKFSTSKLKISYLFYPDFDTDPHPALQASIQVDLETLQVTHRDYGTSSNPFILHRKETFVTPEYPLYQQFAELTRAQEALGLLNNSRSIGTRRGWEERLRAYNVELQGHCLIQYQAASSTGESPSRQIDRHKAAIVRNDFSRPVRTALEAGLFTPDTTFFDYGCGHGGDVTRIAQQGYTSTGWDPYYLPDTPRTTADIVNLGYVINVIEDTGDRREALVKAWELTRKVLLVAAQVTLADTNKGTIAYGDGVVTTRNTFQKYYEQEELKIYIDQVLGVDAIPVALGVYFVFRDEAQAQLFRASRFRSRATTPRVRSHVKRFEDYQELLTPLMSFVTERGRLPSKGELSQDADINAEFGSLRRAFQVILQATDPQEWEAITEKRRQDLLVYLALCQFSRRPKLGELAPSAQEDILALFGTYKQAWLNADQMLHSLGNSEIIVERCQNSQIGKKLPNSLWVHISALQALDPLLRLYEGCASRTIGRLDEANVIKFHTKKPKISYLFYPDFDTDPHPGLHTSMEIDLRDLHVSYRDYDTDDDPPVLHQKDALVTPDYPLYEKFAKLTCQEEDWGLLDNWRNISHRSGWLKCLADHCATLQGYQLSWRKDADPYKLKALRATVKTRQAKRRNANNKNNTE
ncbi:DNA phosphorothioation-associated putative methyltransferase [Nostoc sp. 106C]|uniref:DNA phosphorothioation-associated putative methyltransferase n=1 Tax=Nostoc sp. 106C TaxID=1932667 RepID=UPI000B67FB8F|nr:DNA phosphorothioation-associated putative methyltransferase [Nostoc sp. 106C]OUL32393.1 DNA phosphorothioation-associated methyltransferase [Nostoc sp. 106C]